ncbi:tyrosine-type recombinase/integrase [Streptomyces lunaelactis]|nr:site-specific integrase [Streptomyces lunaelactis]
MDGGAVVDRLGGTRGRRSGFGQELPWGERSGPVSFPRLGQSLDLPAIARCGPRSSRLAPWWLHKAQDREVRAVLGFTGLRFGELGALQRGDVDLERRTVSIRRALAETRTDGLLIKAPKSAAGVRTVAFPASLTAELAVHLELHAESSRTGLVFTGARGGQLRRNNFRRIWLRAVEKAGLGDVHFHDLRHTGNTLAATGGATTRELMQRMGHSSVRAALIYQHLVNGRDHAIAAHVDEQIKKVRPADSAAEGPEEVSGT